MTKARKTLQTAVQGKSSIRFRDFQSLLIAMGFRLDRISGSHHIYFHPAAPRPLSIQPVGNEVKRYQIRQFLDMVEEFGLTLSGDD